MLIIVLEGLNNAKGLIDAAANGKVVDGHGANDALAVDDEETAKGDALLLEKNAILAGDILCKIGNNGNFHLAETALLAGSINPGKVGKLAIDGNGNNLGANLLELSRALGKGNNLSGANEGKIQRVEEHDDVLTSVILKGNRLDLSVDNGVGLPSRSLSSDAGDGDGDVIATETSGR